MAHRADSRAAGSGDLLVVGSVDWLAARSDDCLAADSVFRALTRVELGDCRADCIPADYQVHTAGDCIPADSLGAPEACNYEVGIANRRDTLADSPTRSAADDTKVAATGRVFPILPRWRGCSRRDALANSIPTRPNPTVGS